MFPPEFLINVFSHKQQNVNFKDALSRYNSKCSVAFNYFEVICSDKLNSASILCLQMRTKLIYLFSWN